MAPIYAMRDTSRCIIKYENDNIIIQYNNHNI